MDNFTDQKPKTGAGSESDRAKGGSTGPKDQSMGSYSTLTYIVIALVLIFGALLLFTNNWGTTPPAPTTTQDSTTAPAPDAVAPAPATPPAAETTTPPATDAAPETGTAPQPPVAPAQ